MDRILIAAGSAKGSQAIRELAGSVYRRAQVTEVHSGAHVRRMLMERAFDLVIITSPLPDETGIETACHAASDPSVGVLLLVRAEQAAAVSQEVEAYGVFVLEKPLNRMLFFSAIRFIGTAVVRARGFQSEQVKLREKVEEIRIVDRAKCVLMEYLALTEKQAHRHIEKQAMDLRLTKRQVAENVLKTYEI